MQLGGVTAWSHDWQLPQQQKHKHERPKQALQYPSSGPRRGVGPAQGLAASLIGLMLDSHQLQIHGKPVVL